MANFVVPVARFERMSRRDLGGFVLCLAIPVSYRAGPLTRPSLLASGEGRGLPFTLRLRSCPRSMPRCASRFILQVEGHEPAVLQGAAKLRAKIIAQASVIIEPPEGRPGEHDEGGSGST